jgi:hypothetical protein
MCSTWFARHWGETVADEARAVEWVGTCAARAVSRRSAPAAAGVHCGPVLLVRTPRRACWRGVFLGRCNLRRRGWVHSGGVEEEYGVAQTRRSGTLPLAGPPAGQFDGSRPCRSARGWRARRGRRRDCRGVCGCLGRPLRRQVAVGEPAPGRSGDREPTAVAGQRPARIGLRAGGGGPARRLNGPS